MEDLTSLDFAFGLVRGDALGPLWRDWNFQGGTPPGGVLPSGSRQYVQFTWQSGGNDWREIWKGSRYEFVLFRTLWCIAWSVNCLLAALALKKKPVNPVIRFVCTLTFLNGIYLFVQKSSVLWNGNCGQGTVDSQTCFYYKSLGYFVPMLINYCTISVFIQAFSRSKFGKFISYAMLVIGLGIALTMIVQSINAGNDYYDMKALSYSMNAVFRCNPIFYFIVTGFYALVSIISMVTLISVAKQSHNAQLMKIVKRMLPPMIGLFVANFGIALLNFFFYKIFSTDGSTENYQWIVDKTLWGNYKASVNIEQSIDPIAALLQTYICFISSSSSSSSSSSTTTSTSGATALKSEASR